MSEKKKQFRMLFIMQNNISMCCHGTDCVAQQGSYSLITDDGWQSRHWMPRVTGLGFVYTWMRNAAQNER